MAASFRGLLEGLVEGVRGKNQMEKERQAYTEDALYFKKGSEINDPRPGNKINRSQVDAIVSAANMGVTTGIMNKESGDRFIANQFQELRNDFAVNAKDEKGNIIKLPVTPGATNRAADILYGLKSGQGITFYEPNRETKTGREFSSEGKRYATEDPNSPYAKGIPPEQLLANSKIALLTWVSKQGKTLDETTMNWNGDARYGAKEHLEKVKRREVDLSSDYNKDLREYIAERSAYDSKYKVTSNSKYYKEGWEKELTTLTPKEESEFRTWVKGNKVPFNVDTKDPTDYDMRGFYKAQSSGNSKAKASINKSDNQLHYPDTYKTPLHKSFSNESKWALPNAPRWNDKNQLVDSKGKILVDESEK
jgi:hypothetical protein